MEGQITGRMIAKKIIEFAMEGKFPFAKEILDRTEGKVPDRTKLSGDEGPPIQAVDLSAMSLEQLLEFYSRLKKAKEEEDQDHYDGSDPTE
ncbi:hypothetical protein GTO10_04275 [Candidatus Saccharibacteria bacterium]|nr:hypothetical protein [Candidatus Saccharibacteria bacterium]